MPALRVSHFVRWCRMWTLRQSRTWARMRTPGPQSLLLESERLRRVLVRELLLLTIVWARLPQTYPRLCARKCQRQVLMRKYLPQMRMCPRPMCVRKCWPLVLMRRHRRWMRAWTCPRPMCARKCLPQVLMLARRLMLSM